MQVTRTDRGGVALFRLHGRLDSSSGAQVQAAVRPALEAGVNRLVLDLGGVEFVSSAGLRVLLLTAKQARAAGGAAALFGASGPVHEVFEISGLTVVIPVSETEAAAVRAAGG